MFDDFADAYEAMIDWPKRLAHEEPFYRRLFDRLGAGSVIDVACGTGHHAAMFHSWGLRVEGADLSPAMIDRAKANFGQPQGLNWTVRGFDEPVEPVTASKGTVPFSLGRKLGQSPAESFDAAVCIGNSLALAIAYIWITEDLYDKDYVAKRTVGFDEWKDYILGKEDGVPTKGATCSDVRGA